MKNQWQKLVCIVLTFVFLLSTALACSGGGNEATAVPVVELKKAAPGNLDLAGRTEVALATPGEGAIMVNEAARLWVPPGAVTEDTPVTIKACNEVPGSMKSTVADAPEVTLVSNIYDLGPDNTKFAKPVKVTLAYAEDALPAGADENNIGPIYYDGRNWVPLERELDTEKNTVTFETMSFPGTFTTVAFGLTLGWKSVVAIGAIDIATVVYAGYETYLWYTDPLYSTKAYKYITPDDPVVKEWADKQVSLNDGKKVVDVKDIFSNPEKLKDFIDAGNGFVQFKNLESITQPAITPDYQGEGWIANDWKMPAYYLTHGLKGDCKNIAYAMASIFRRYGLPAKCVDGYMVNDKGETKRHGWLEVSIDGKPYYVGSHGEIMPLDDAAKEYTLTRPKGVDGEGYMVDETGQQPYKNNWWVNSLQVAIDASKAFPNGKVGVKVYGIPGVSILVDLTVMDSKDKPALYKDVTDETTGICEFTVPISESAPKGIYRVIANGLIQGKQERNLVGTGEFSVDILKISADTVQKQFTPGETMVLNIRLNYPVQTNIEISGYEGRHPTNEKGVCVAMLPISQKVKPDTYTLTIRVRSLASSRISIIRLPPLIP